MCYFIQNPMQHTTTKKKVWGVGSVALMIVWRPSGVSEDDLRTRESARRVTRPASSRPLGAS